MTARMVFTPFMLAIAPGPPGLLQKNKGSVIYLSMIPWNTALVV